MPNVDELFPEQGRSVDALFPVEFERERNRQRQFNTSPVQDLIFGDTSVNPVARVLDAFGQGARHAWGSHNDTVSKESEEFLKASKQYDAWIAGQTGITKAAHDVLFRPAATQIYREFRDAQAIFHGIGAGIEGTKAAIAQIGVEAGQEKLGKEVAAGFEAFPTGFRQPAGTFPRMTLADYTKELERARDLKTVGAGEAGYQGTADVPAPAAKEVAPIIRDAAEDVKPVEPVAPVLEAPVEQPARVTSAPINAEHPIAQDVTARLVKAGRPAEEASASGQIIASHYESRAARFGGELGTAQELYAREGANIKPGRGVEPAPAEVRPEPKPLEGGAVETAGLMEFNQAAYHGSPYDFEAFDTGKIGTGEGAAAYGHGLYFAENRETAKAYQRALAKDRDAFNVGGRIVEKPSPEFAAADLVHKFGEAPNSIAKRLPDEPAYIDTKNVLKKWGDTPPEITPGRGNLYRVDIKPEPHDFLPWDKPVTDKGMLDRIKAAADKIKPGWYERLMGQGKDLAKWSLTSDEMGPRTGETIYGALRRGLGSDRAASEALRGADIPGIRYLDQGSRGAGEGTHNYVVFDPKNIEILDKNGKPVSRKEFELDQVKRGKIRFNEDAKPVITLFKDANESTFIHETGHHWLEELMRDAKHEKAPTDLIADSKAVLGWFGVDDVSKIKTRHHEQFARGFERYMMEGVAPSRELASVFAKFRDWLTRIYETVTRLKSPINDEIRGVFDRLIAQDPERIRIEPEAPKAFSEIHEADALHTPPEASRPVAETIRAERDRLAAEQFPEENDARLEGVASGTGRREAGGAQPLRDRNATEPGPQEAGRDQAPRTVGAGGSNAPAEGAGPSAQPRTEVPVSAGEPFKPTESPLVDKAGNIRLDNLSTAEDVNAAIRDAAEKNNEFIDARRGVVTDGQVLELADALGMDAGQLNQRKLGQAFNAEQIMAARKLLIQSATTVRDTMIKAANGTEADIMAYAAAKDRHQMIQSHVAGITAEAGRALRAFRKLEGQQEAAQIDAFLKDNTGKTLFQLQREAQLGMQLDTPAQVSKFINDSSKPTFKEMIIEAWMASLLSGLRTHAANITGNTISGLWRPLETVTAAGIGKARSLVTGSHDRVLFGEAAAEMFGMVHGSKEGIVAAYKAFKSEEPQMTSTRQIEQGNPRALPSMTVNLFGREMEIGGKQARIPLRLLGAEDEFFKSVAFRGDINRQAYAIAAKENLPQERMNARVAELASNPTEEMVAKAKDVADYQTFQTPLGKVGRSVQNFANAHILAKFIVPFVRTPMNLLKYAGERTPLGLFAQEVRDNLAGKNGNVARDTQIARISLGTMAGIAAFEMAANGYITGGGPGDKGKKSIMQADGWQDYSVRIGDMYYRYNRLDPFSIILGVAADAYEVMKSLGSDHPDKEHIPAMAFAAITKNILNRASLQGMSDVIQAVSDPERYGKGYIKSMAGTIVPALSAQTTQTLDPVVRQTRTVLDHLKSRIPGLSQDLKPRRDIWGEEVTRQGGLGPDIASPIAESRLKNDPVNKALIAANYFPGKLDRKIRGVELDDQQYDDYTRIAGRTAKMRLNTIVQMPGFERMPEAVRKDLMTKAITSSREMARSLILMQSPEILRKANDAKMATMKAN